MKKLTVVLLLLLMTPALSFAAGKHYREGDLYTVVNASNPTNDGIENGFTFQIGYDLSQYLAVEGHLGWNPEHTENFTGGQYIKTSTAYASVVARGNLRFERTTLFAFAGATTYQYGVKINDTVLGYSSDKETETGATFGFGIDLYGSKDAALTFKTVTIFKEKGGNITEDLKATMFGITYYIE